MLIILLSPIWIALITRSAEKPTSQPTLSIAPLIPQIAEFKVLKSQLRLVASSLKASRFPSIARIVKLVFASLFN
nr:MAG TPA: hypothetical protein [Caudoviricetes sp.]